MRCHACCFALVLVLTTLKGTNGSTTQRTMEVTPAVNSSSTKSPGTESPGQDCSNGIYQCWQDWYIEFETAPSEDGSCRAINKLADCYLGLDQCDPNYIRFELIPGTYILAQQQGLPCVAPTFSPPGTTVNQLPDFTTKTPQPTGGTYRTTTQQTTEVTPGADCLDGLKVCRKDLDAADINSLSTEQFCGLLGQASACYLQLSQCDRNWVQYVLIPGEYEEARKQQNFCQLPDFKTTTPQPTSAVNSSSTKSPGTESPGPDCSTGIQLCLNDYTADAMAVTSLTDFCRIAKNLADCFLDLDQCDQNYIRFELIPGTYSVIQQQGLPCVAPTFAPPGTTVNPPRTSTTKLSTAKSTVTSPVWSTSSTSRSYTGTSQRPSTGLPGQDCEAALESCVRKYAELGSTATSTENMCRYIEILCHCFLKQDACDKNYILYTVIPYSYASAQQQGITCKQPDFTHTTTTTVTRTTTRLPTTVQPALQFCDNEIRQCQTDFEKKVPYSSYSEYCQLIYSYRDCMWNIGVCDYGYLRRTIEDYVGANIRDCDRDTSAQSGQTPLRPLDWPGILTLLILSSLMQLLSPWLFI